jgi:hypothetical protein
MLSPRSAQTQMACGSQVADPWKGPCQLGFLSGGCMPSRCFCQSLSQMTKLRYREVTELAQLVSVRSHKCRFNAPDKPSPGLPSRT